MSVECTLHFLYQCNNTPAFHGIVIQLLTIDSSPFSNPCVLINVKDPIVNHTAFDALFPPYPV